MNQEPRGPGKTQEKKSGVCGCLDCPPERAHLRMGGLPGPMSEWCHGAWLGWGPSTTSWRKEGVALLNPATISSPELPKGVGPVMMFSKKWGKELHKPHDRLGSRRAHTHGHTHTLPCSQWTRVPGKIPDCLDSSNKIKNLHSCVKSSNTEMSGPHQASQMHWLIPQGLWAAHPLLGQQGCLGLLRLTSALAAEM